MKYWPWEAGKRETIMICKKLKITVEQTPFQREKETGKGKKQILDEPQSISLAK